MKYISYSESKISEEKRKQNNQKYIEQELIKQKQYFDEMFKKIDSNIILDEEQRKIILTEEDNLMVIAGAGTGKTTTITAKVNYLIEKLNIKEEEIIIISYTNKAIQELKQRINIDFKHKVDIMTFHKFAYKIIKKNIYTPPKIISDNTNIIKEYIEEKIIKNKKLLNKFLDLYIYYFDISEDILFFSNYEKYNKYKYNQDYATLNEKIQYINLQKKENANEHQEFTAKNLETKIEEFLYINNIKYKCKEKYKKQENYIPDFTIYQNSKEIYIECFDIEKIKKYKYQQYIEEIKKIHKKNKTKLIEIYRDDPIKQLEEQLKKNKINIIKKDNIEIFNKIINQKGNQKYKKFIIFASQYINLFKAKGYNYSDFKKINAKTKRTKIYIQFIKELYKYYEEKLVRENKIDFEGIIDKANNIISNQEKIELPYKYIFIDEYQDISESKFKLIKNLTQKLKPKTIVVGDDWQCIYSFASSNLNLFINYKKQYPHCEIKKIIKTYRNSQELINIAGKFIQKNNFQIKKKLISNKKIKEPIKIITYKNKKIVDATIKGIEYIRKKYGDNKNILIIGRYTFDKNKILDNYNIKEKKENIIYIPNPKLKIKYMTAHSSKGLGYDNVIIINGLNETLGFPSKIKIDPIMKPLITIEKNIKYAEERRLFYVALTRTKNEVIILKPINNESEFIKEIKKVIKK